MSSSINTLNGNGMSLQFEEFARLAGEEAFGAIVEETLAQVERWQKILGGLREAENTLADQTAEATASFDINAFIQV